jgi:MFS family permease
VRDLRLLAGAVFLSSAGDLLALVTLVLLVHDITGSGVAVSALFATTLVPVVALGPVAGLLADRVESVRLLAITSVAQALVAAALAFTDGLTGILALSALLTAGATIGQPAEFALVPAVAGKGGLTRANGLVESARYAGFAAGPALAGAITAAGGPRLALLVNAASFLAIAVAALLMRARRLPEPGTGRSEARARDGIAHLLGDRVLRATVLAATAGLAFVSACLTLEVFYIKDVLGLGNSGFALLTAVWMAGMVVGATGLAPRVPAKALAGAGLVALAVQGAGLALQTVWAIVPMAVIGYAIGGLGHGAKNTLLRTTIQVRVPADVHGRAFAAYNAARNTAELGAVGVGGLMLAALGPRMALLVAGVGCALAGLAGFAALQRPSEARRERTRAAERSKDPRRRLPLRSAAPSALAARSPAE